jgi:hypothetical protein
MKTHGKHGGDMFLQYFGWLSSDSMVLYPGR